jgi:hypothetical protein
MYRRPGDGEWAGYNPAVRLSTAAAGIIIIDDDGGASADAKGKAPL